MRERPALIANAADPQQVKRARHVEQRREAQWLAALGEVLRTREGRHVLWDLLERAGLHETSLHANPYQVYALEGRRSYGLELLAAIQQVDSDGRYHEMDREARARQAHEDRSVLAMRPPKDPAERAEGEDP